MTRLERFQKYLIRYSKEVAKLKELIPELADVDSYMIQELYSDWSEYYECSGWVGMNDKHIAEFRAYLLEEV